MSTALDVALDRAGQIILGKPRALRLSLTCLLAGGHLLIDDVPGVGKTTLAQTLAHVLGLEFQRIQFTSDLLPADILGATVLESAEGKRGGRFVFHRGPIFAQLILADEVNRASPKTQSALLEAMEERQVTVDGCTRALPQPFFVIATQNPAEQIGTFALPESQLDRFLMRLSLGYPPRDAERGLLMGRDRRVLLRETEPALDAAALLQWQDRVTRVHVSEALVAYLLDLVRRTRQDPGLREGLSPRAGLALKRAAQAWALLEGRNMVIPEDVQAVFEAVVGHRLRRSSGADSVHELTRTLLNAVAIP